MRGFSISNTFLYIVDMKTRSTLSFLILLIVVSSRVATAQRHVFPDDWVGQYKGYMYIDTKDNVEDTVEVDFGLTQMIKDSLWSYKMIFHSKQYGMILKDYLIHVKSKDDSINYILDQKNGVQIEMTYMNNCFYGMYKLNNTIYSSILKKVDTGILFEIYTVAIEAPNYSVLNVDKDKKIDIESYKPQVVQSALLFPRH